MIKLLMAVTSGAALVGCSSFSTTADTEDNIDQEYVAKVERSARMGNAQVTWIARPTKRTTTVN